MSVHISSIVLLSLQNMMKTALNTQKCVPLLRAGLHAGLNAGVSHREC
jgi:hypothetical protein